MKNEFDVPPAVRKYYRVKTRFPRGGKLHRELRCRDCGAGWSYPWQPMSIGTQLKLLDHAYSHNGTANRESADG